MKWKQGMTVGFAAMLMLGVAPLVGCDVDDQHEIEVERQGAPDTEIRYDDDMDRPVHVDD